jgi:hypothetical protein
MYRRKCNKIRGHGNDSFTVLLEIGEIKIIL